MSDDIASFLARLHPYDSVDPVGLLRIATRFEAEEHPAGARLYSCGDAAPGLYVIREGAVRVTDAAGQDLSRLGPGNSFGERGLLRDGLAATSALTETDCRLYRLPPEALEEAMRTEPAFARFFHRGEARRAPERPPDLATTPVAQLMTPDPVTCRPGTPAAEAARIMAEARISCLCVTDGEARLVGIVTVRDLSGRILGRGRSPETGVGQVMTPEPHTLPATALGSDVLHAMMERGIGHVPITEGGRLVGIVTQTNLTRRQAVNSAWLVGDIAHAPDAEAIAGVTALIPRLLAQLTGAGLRHDVVTRLVTDIADAATRRLLALAEEEFGPPPVPYLWLACGSQGRREQTGVSDQDNCLILDDAARDADDAYFARLARFVCDGLNRAGYVYCPGEMMATAPRWRQPLRVWRGYFQGWIATPSPEAQMLASVMFDLRPIGGETGLFESLQAGTLLTASKNSIFVAHMVANSLRHQPPLGLLRGIATIRSGEHRDAVDLKMSGVVPVVDLARLYALMGRIAPVSTRARLELAGGGPGVSAGGARELIDAYDLIAATRLAHQARQIAAGTAPDNYLAPSSLSDFERSHLRDAFVVVRRMQAAIAQGRGTVT